MHPQRLSAALISCQGIRLAMLPLSISVLRVQGPKYQVALPCPAASMTCAGLSPGSVPRILACAVRTIGRVVR